MKQKIVIQVPKLAKGGDVRRKVFNVLTSVKGVKMEALFIDETKTDEVVVIGEVDPVTITLLLRKKFGQANILTVEIVKEEKVEANPAEVSCVIL